MEANGNKKIRLLTLATTLVYLLLLPYVTAYANVVNMCLGPEWQQVEIGQTFNLTVCIDNSYATEFDTILSWISFNPAYLKVQDADPGSPGVQIESDPLDIFGFNYHMANTADNFTGYIDFEESYLSGGTSNKSGVFARITVKAVALTSSSSIDFEFDPIWGMTPTTGILRGGNDVLALSSDHTDGTIGASVEIVPEPRSLILLGSGLLGILVVMKKRVGRGKILR